MGADDSVPAGSFEGDASPGRSGPAATLDRTRFSDPTFFVPRSWLADQVDAWVTADEASPALVISGPPGAGKSRFTYAWAVGLGDDPGRLRLGALILRDLRGQQVDPFSWALLRDQLLALGEAPAWRSPGISGHAEVKVAMPGSKVEAFGTNIEKIMGDFVINAIDPVRELNSVVLPTLDQLGEGDPIFIVIDGLDEAYRSNATDFLEAVQKLVRHVCEQRRKQAGAGRLRFVFTSQPEAPIHLDGLPPATVIDLSRPAPADREDLRTYVHALLSPLPAADRDRLADQISEQAGGIWVIAFYVAQAIAEDIAAGQPVPVRIRMPASLGDAYEDAIGRARSRLGGPGPRWAVASRLLALAAAAQDVGAGLPPDVAALALDTDESTLDGLLVGMRSILSRTPDGTLRFFHGDFGRWVIAGGVSGSTVATAHDQLAEVLTGVGTGNWRLTGGYCVRYVAEHALAAAELSTGKVTHASHVARCLRLFADRDRLASDPHPARWLDQLSRLAFLCPAGTRLAGAVEPVAGLAPRIAAALELPVGARLAKALSDAQLGEFEQFIDLRDRREGLAWLNRSLPAHGDVVNDEFRRMFAGVLAGAPIVDEPDRSGSTIGHMLHEAWETTRDPRLLDAAVEARRSSLRRTPPDHAERTSRLLGLTLCLEAQAESHEEQDGLLDELLQVRAELIHREDLSDHVKDPVISWRRYAYLLARRYARDPGQHPADLADAIGAWESAIALAPDLPSERAVSLMGLADVLGLGIEAEPERATDVDRLIEIQGEVVACDDLPDKARAWQVYAVWLDHRHAQDPDGHAGDLDAAISAWERAVAETPPDDPARVYALTGLANALGVRIDSGSVGDGDLDRVIEVHADIIACTDREAVDADVASIWDACATARHRRWLRGPEEHAPDLDGAIEAWHRAIQATPVDHPRRADRLISLANGLTERVGTETEQVDDLDVLIDLHRELTDRPDLSGHIGDPGQAWELYATCLEDRIRRDNRPQDAAVIADAWERAVDLTPAEADSRPLRLIGLIQALAIRIDAAERDGDLDRLIDAQTELVGRDDLSSHVDSNAAAWAAYASSLDRRARREQEGCQADLSASVDAWQRAVDQTADDDTERPGLLIGLANALIAQVRAEPDSPDQLDRLLDVQRQVVGCSELPPSSRGQAWRVYGYWLSWRQAQDPNRHPEDLDAAVDVWEQALAATPAEDPHRTGCLIELANALTRRTRTDSGREGDLDRLIAVQGEVVRTADLSSADGLDVAMAWAAYGAALDQRLHRDPEGHREDLDSSIVAWGHAVERTPTDHAERTRRLTGLAEALAARINAVPDHDSDLQLLLAVTGEVAHRDDLSDHGVSPRVAWSVYADALDRRRRQPGAPWIAYTQLAVAAWERALTHAPAGDPGRTAVLVRLADTLTSRFDVDRQEGDVERLVEVRRELVGREDLAERVGDPAVTWARFGRALLFQWEEDPVANAGNLGEFLTAMETCLGLSSESRPYWFAWLADGGNAHLLAYLNGLPNADLSLAIDRARAVLTSGDAEDHDRLLPALRRLAGQEHRSVAAEQPVGLR